MSTTVFKKYENKCLHVKSYGLENDKDNNTVIHHFCDNNLVEYLEKTEVKSYEFNNVPYTYNRNVLTLGASAIDINQKIIKSSWQHSANGLESCEYIYNNFNLENIEYNIKFSFRNRLKTNESLILSDYTPKLISMNQEEIKINDIKEFHSDTVMYEGVSFKLRDISINDNNTISGIIDLGYSYLECPRCNEKFLMNEIESYKSSAILGIYLYDDEEHVKVTIMKKEVKTKHVLSWIRYYKDMYIYKKETSNFYKVENFNTAGSTYLKNKKKKIVKNVNFGCASFFGRGIYLQEGLLLKAKYMFKELVFSHLEEKFGDEYRYTKIDSESLIEKEDYKFIYLLQIKKQYKIKNTLLANFILTAKNVEPGLYGRLKNKTEKEIMEYFRLNTKKLKKVNTGERAQLYLFLYNLLDDINNVNIVFDKVYSLNNYKKVAQYKDLYFQYKKNNTEKRLVNQLTSNSRYIIEDTQKLFIQIKEQMKDYSVDYTKNIKDLHDIFSKDITKLKHDNQKIKKNKAINNIFNDIEINSIKYSLAKDTDELIKAGAIMDICVGGYSRDAVSQKCFIVLGYDKDNKPVTCIELVKGKKGLEVKQVKKRKNWTPKESENNALAKLFEDNKIVIDTNDLDITNTYQRLKEDDSERLGKLEKFTYARNVPDEIIEEMIG